MSTDELTIKILRNELQDRDAVIDTLARAIYDFVADVEDENATVNKTTYEKFINLLDTHGLPKEKEGDLL